MIESDFGDVIQSVKIFADYDRPWVVCGGWGIELFLNRITRSHKDVDFAVLQRNQFTIQEYLLSRGWTLEKAVSGQLIPWKKGEWIDVPVHTIWCKNSKGWPDCIELLFNEVDRDNFLFRRDTTITLPLEKMIMSSVLGIPRLAPEIVLLYKSSKSDDPSVAADFKNAMPGIPYVARDWLITVLKMLDSNHIWLKDLLYS